MKELALEARDYAGTYKLVGGRPSLDFVNTVSTRDADAPHDWLDPPINLLAWARACELVDEPTVRALTPQATAGDAATERAMARVREQRSILRQVLEPLTRDSRPEPPDVEALNQLMALSSRFRTLDPVRLEWTWEQPLRLDEVTRPVIVDAAKLLADADRSRLGSCPACGWLFYDSTKNRARRWCDMADCGSREKSRRYYYRKLARSNRD